MNKIPLSGKHGKGEFALVDDDTYEELSKHKWHVDTEGYATRRAYFEKAPPGPAVSKSGYRYRDIFMHRVVHETPEGSFTDHINGDKLDNRRGNLRTCTTRQNGGNRKISSNNTTGYKGVIYMPHVSKKSPYRAAIYFKYKRYHIGSFSNAIDAAKAYNEKAKEFFGEFARLNIIPEEPSH